MKSKLIATIVGAGMLVVSVVAYGAGGTGYTGAPAPTVGILILTPGVPASLVTNNVEVVGVQMVTPSGNGTASFFDSSTLAAPYYGTNSVNAAYLSTAGYPTNYVTSYVGYNGYTNWYTNAGYFTYTVTNAAATNALNPKSVLPLISGQITSGNNAMLFTKGVVVVATTNATAIISYIPNR